MSHVGASEPSLNTTATPFRPDIRCVSTAVSRRVDLRRAGLDRQLVDPKWSLAWVARQRIGGLQKVILVVSNAIPIALRGTPWISRRGCESWGWSAMWRRFR